MLGRIRDQQWRVAGEPAQLQPVVVVERADAPARGGIERRRVGRPAGNDGQLQPVEAERRAVRDGDVDRDASAFPRCCGESRITRRAPRGLTAATSPRCSSISR